MATISVVNTDWAIVEAVQNALAAATIQGAAVFEAVTVTTSNVQAGQCQFQDSPIAMLRYVTTREDDSPEGVRGCAVLLEMILAAQVCPTGVSESSRLQEALRLKNAAVNAVEQTPPDDSSAWGDGNHYHPRIHWGPAEIDTEVRQPWAVCRLPVEIGFVLNGPTSH
jgi:hypothetical protein